jgi:uncharacterized membrane protein
LDGNDVNASDRTRQDAQRRVDRIHAFETELAALEAAGVIALPDTQRSAIAAHHGVLIAQLTSSFDIDRDARSKQLSLGMRAASFLGALAFAASVVFLFYQYWGRLGTATQVSVLVCASLLSFTATVLIRGRDGAGYFSKLAALVAFSCFVLNIAMFGQIFNITPSDKALLVWGALAFLLAYACDLRLMLAVGLLCILGFTSARVGEWGGLYWLDFGERPENFFPAAALILGVPLFAPHKRFGGFASTYRLLGLLAVLLPMLALSFWGQGSYINWDPRTVAHCYQVIGFVASAAAIWLGTRWNWAETSNTGVVFFVIFLFTKFYDWWWESMPKYLFFLLLGLTALLALFVMRRLRSGIAPDTGNSR